MGQLQPISWQILYKPKGTQRLKYGTKSSEYYTVQEVLFKTKADSRHVGLWMPAERATSPIRVSDSQMWILGPASR